MSTNRKSGAAWKETRHDKYYHLAKDQGYRSRAAFKLIQLNKKYNFLSTAKSCLDLCAAPGGWTQVASKYMPVSSMLISVDLLPIKPIKGALTVQCDITSQQCKGILKKHLQGWNCDLILNDGAPNVAGGQAWSKDAYQQVELVIYSLRLVTAFLRPGGTFVTKIFRSQDYNALLWVLQQFFHRVEVTKPAASRSASAEIFAVCLDYKAPPVNRIDPALLDPNIIFQHFDGTGDAKKDVNVFKQRESAKGVRSRSGYDTTSQLLYTECKATEFVNAASTEAAIDMLGKFNRFTFPDDDAESQTLKALAETGEEIVELCEDLKVLGKGDFKSLVKWRKKVRTLHKKLTAQEASHAPVEPAAPAPVLTEEEAAAAEEKRLSQELLAFKAKQAHEKKKEKRKKREQKNKAKAKLTLNSNNRTDAQELLAGESEQGLFSLAAIKELDMIDELDNIGKQELEDDDDEDDDEGQAAPRAQADSEDDDDNEGSDEGDSDDDYYGRLEANLDAMYEKYQESRNAGKRKRGAKADKQDEAKAEAVENKKAEKQRAAKTDEDDKGALMVDFPEPTESDAIRAQRWFDQDIFKATEVVEPAAAQPKKAAKALIEADSEESEESEGEQMEEELEDEEEEEPAKPVIPRLKGLKSLDKSPAQLAAEEKTSKRHAKEAARNARKAAARDDVDADGDPFYLKDQDSAKKAKRMERKENKRKFDEGPGAGDAADGGKSGDFEEVAAEPSDSDEELDMDSQAMTLALGHRMIDKRNREELMDNSYNRYSMDLEEIKGLPAWFVEDECPHSQPMLPVTAEEVSTFKQRLQQLNTRPIKKIAEARARKSEKTAKRWEKIKAKADSIAKDEATSEGAKMKEIQKLFHKKDKRENKERKYIVSKKGGGTTQAKKGSGKIVRVDKRLKKDKRGTKSSEKRSNKSTKNNNKRRKMK